MSGRQNEPEQQPVTLEAAIAGGLLGAMALMVFAGVLSRYVFHQSISFAEELVRHGFVWATFLGAAAAARSGAHLGVSLLPDRLQGRVRAVVLWLQTGAVVAFFFALAWHGALAVKLQFVSDQRTPALGWPFWIIGVAAPVGALLIIARSLQARVTGR